MQIIIIVILAAAVGFVGYTVLKSVLMPRKTETIERYVHAGKISAAIKLAKNILAKDPGDFLAHYYLGHAYLKDNKPELALMEFKIVNQRAIFSKAIPENQFRKTIGQLYLKFNHDEEALKEFLLLTKLEPNNAENYYSVGKLFEDRGKGEQALGYYKKTVQLNSKHVKAYAALGLLLFRAKQFPEAKKTINHAIALSPNTFSTYYYLGKILKESKDYPAAVNAFEKALRDPDFKQKALLERGSCFMLANSVEKAAFEFERAVRSTQNESSQETLFARYYLAACYEKMRKIDSAITEWEEIYKKNKNFKDVPAKLAEYKDIQANDNIKEYLTSSSDQFIEFCKEVAKKSFNCSPKDTLATKYGCKMLATDAKNSEDWRAVREAVRLVIFHRDAVQIGEDFLRALLDEMKKQSINNAIICTSAGFTRSAIAFAESRPFELIGKEKLDSVLSI